MQPERGVFTTPLYHGLGPVWEFSPLFLKECGQGAQMSLFAGQPGDGVLRNAFLSGRC